MSTRSGRAYQNSDIPSQSEPDNLQDPNNSINQRRNNLIQNSEINKNSSSNRPASDFDNRVKSHITNEPPSEYQTESNSNNNNNNNNNNNSNNNNDNNFPPLASSDFSSSDDSFEAIRRRNLSYSDYRLPPNARRIIKNYDVNKNESSFKVNKIFFKIIFIIIGIICVAVAIEHFYSIISSKAFPNKLDTSIRLNAKFYTSSEIVSNISSLKELFPKNQGIFQNLSNQVKNHVREQNAPLCITFIANVINLHVQDCLIKKLSKSITNEILLIYDTQDVTDSALNHIVATNLSLIGYFKEVNNASKSISAFFHALCDESYPPYKNAIFIFTLSQDDNILNTTSKASNVVHETFKLYWSEKRGFHYDEVSAVINRIAPISYIILPETDTFKCN